MSICRNGCRTGCGAAWSPPDLSPLGYRLLGGRLLATEHGGAAALFVYDDADGHRLTVLLRPMAPELRAVRTDGTQGN